MIIRALFRLRAELEGVFHLLALAVDYRVLLSLPGMMRRSNWELAAEPDFATLFSQAMWFPHMKDDFPGLRHLLPGASG